jgi:hypothetical protein
MHTVPRAALLLACLLACSLAPSVLNDARSQDKVHSPCGNATALSSRQCPPAPSLDRREGGGWPRCTTLLAGSMPMLVPAPAPAPMPCRLVCLVCRKGTERKGWRGGRGATELEGWSRCGDNNPSQRLDDLQARLTLSLTMHRGAPTTHHPPACLPACGRGKSCGDWEQRAAVTRDAGDTTRRNTTRRDTHTECVHGHRRRHTMKRMYLRIGTAGAISAGGKVLCVRARRTSLFLFPVVIEGVRLLTEPSPAQPSQAQAALHPPCPVLAPLLRSLVRCHVFPTPFPDSEPSGQLAVWRSQAWEAPVSLDLTKLARVQHCH